MSRELDAKVHTAVFGQPTEIRDCKFYLDDGCWQEAESYVGADTSLTQYPCYKDGDEWYVVPFYSKDIVNAWRLIEELTPYLLSGRIDMENCDGIRYDCVIYDAKSGGDYNTPGGIWTHACDTTAPLAICHAAILTAEKLRKRGDIT